jgi:hypothetical protein
MIFLPSSRHTLEPHSEYKLTRSNLCGLESYPEVDAFSGGESHAGANIIRVHRGWLFEGFPFDDSHLDIIKVLYSEVHHVV